MSVSSSKLRGGGNRFGFRPYSRFLSIDAVRRGIILREIRLLTCSLVGPVNNLSGTTNKVISVADVISGALHHITLDD